MDKEKMHTSSIIGRNSLAGWNKLTSLPYITKEENYSFFARLENETRNKFLKKSFTRLS